MAPLALGVPGVNRAASFSAESRVPSIVSWRCMPEATNSASQP